MRGQTVLLGLVDQGVSSGTNFLMLYLIIRTSDLGAIGVFMLAYTLFFLFLGIAKGLCSDPFTIAFSSREQSEQRHQLSAALGAMVGISILSGLCSLAVAALGSGSTRGIFAALAICLPALFVQDGWRAAGFAEGSPQRSLSNDLVMAGGQALIYGALFQSDTVSPTTLVLGWGGGALRACIWGCRQFEVIPNVRRARVWLKETRALGTPLAADYAVNRGAEQAVITIMSAVGSLALQGAVSTTRSLFAPLTTVQSGISGVMLPEISKASAVHHGRRVRWLALSTAGTMGLLMTGYGLFLALMPQEWGLQALGQNWLVASQLLPPMTVFNVLNAIAFGLWLGTRASGAHAQTVKIRTWGGILMFVLAGIGTAYSAALAVWGMTVATGVVSLALMATLVRRTRLLESTRTGVSTTHG